MAVSEYDLADGFRYAKSLIFSELRMTRLWACTAIS
jgi:hypothetical protein